MNDAMTKPNGWTGEQWHVGREFGAEHLKPSIQILRDVVYVEGGRPTTYIIGEVTYPTTNGATVGAEERRANARLIAAAPSLYEALADLIDSHPGDGDWKKCRAKARAALSAVDGGV